MLNIIVPLFDMGRSCGKVKSRKNLEKVQRRSWKNL